MTNPTNDVLQRYDRFKLALSDAIRLAIDKAREAGDVATSELLKGTIARLAAEQFNVAFVGQFSRGKSTVMNALIKRDLLPVGVVPLTSVITTVRYGSRPRVIIRYPNSLLTREIEVSELPQYVTQFANPGNIKEVEKAEIQTPSDLLLRGVCLVDTPGIGSAIEENTKTTERFLPEADAFVVVTAVDSPMTRDEAHLLRNAIDLSKKVFLVLNKADLVNGKQLLECVNYANEVAGGISPEIQVYPLSARNQTQTRASEAGDDSWLRFEADLRMFLAQDRGAPLLLNNCDRVLAALRAASPVCAISAIVSVVEQIRAEIASLPDRGADLERLKLPSLPQSQTCLVCSAIATKVFDFLSQYQYAIATDAQTRAYHDEVGGFCDLHTWQYENLASPRGVCAAYPPLLRRVAEGLDRDDLPFVPRECPACEIQNGEEQEQLREVLRHVDEDKEVQLLCVPHLKLASKDGCETRLHRLNQSLSNALTHMAETMERFTMKQEALRRDLQSEEEQRVHRRALALLVGQRQIKTHD